jgi:hypothetical protein
MSGLGKGGDTDGHTDLSSTGRSYQGMMFVRTSAFAHCERCPGFDVAITISESVWVCPQYTEVATHSAWGQDGEAGAQWRANALWG